jgi:hypothetical protein
MSVAAGARAFDDPAIVLAETILADEGRRATSHELDQIRSGLERLGRGSVGQGILRALAQQIDARGARWLAEQNSERHAVADRDAAQRARRRIENWRAADPATRAACLAAEGAEPGVAAALRRFADLLTRDTSSCDPPRSWI